MKSFEQRGDNIESPDRNRIKESITKLREELKILTDPGTLVIDLEKWIEEGRLPLGEQGDILIDVMRDHADDVREYLGSETEYIIVKDGPGPRYETGGGYWFVIKLDR